MAPRSSATPTPAASAATAPTGSTCPRAPTPSSPARLLNQTVTSPSNPNVNANGLNINLSYLPYGTIKGIAQDDAGSRLANTVISTYLSSGFGIQVVTQSDGTFSMLAPHTPSGFTYTLSALARTGYVTPGPISGVALAVGGTTDLSTTPFVFTRFGAIAGKVLDQNNQPVSGVTVTLWQNSLPTRFSTVSDVTGSYSIAAPNGSYTVVGSDLAGFLNLGPNPSTVAVTAGVTSQPYNLE